MSKEVQTTENQPAVNIIQLVLMFFGCIAALICIYFLLTPATEPAILVNAQENIKPIAMVDVSPNGGVHIAQSGEYVVKNACVACHAAGALGAPIIADKSQWAPRIAQGYDKLVKHAINGIRGMPARGGNADLTDEEVAAAVVVMANQSGANFKLLAPAK